MKVLFLFNLFIYEKMLIQLAVTTILFFKKKKNGYAEMLR
jgi:hypothetical protein